MEMNTIHNHIKVQFPAGGKKKSKLGIELFGLISYDS